MDTLATSRPVVLITGASAGVGRALAHELARRNMRLALIARGEKGLQSTLLEVEQLGGQAMTFVADVADADQLEKAAQATEERFGPIDVWVNNAMATVLSEFSKVTPEEFARVTHVTYLGTVHGTMAALRRMLPRDYGHIIQVGSALAYRAIPLQSAYCGAKHAVRGFTDSIRSELIHNRSKVHLTMAQLPGMNTPQFEWCRTRFTHQPQPVPPIFDPHVSARAIADIVGKHCRELYITGSCVKVVVGSKLVPTFLDHYLAKKAYGGQQAAELLPADHGDNLFEPDNVDRGARGPFSNRSKTRSVQTRLTVARVRMTSALRQALSRATRNAARQLKTFRSRLVDRQTES